MAKILKKGWFVIVVIFITFTLLGFFIPWTFCKGNGKIIKFKYTTKLDVDVYDYTREENINKVKSLTTSMYTGGSLTTYQYVNIKKIEAVEKDGYYQITVNKDAFSDSNIKNAETTAKGFMRHLTLVVAETYVDLADYPDYQIEKKDKEGNVVTDDEGNPIMLNIKGISNIFDVDFYEKNSLDKSGNLLISETKYKRNDMIILGLCIGAGVGIILGFTLTLLLGKKFSDKLEREEEIFDNETVFKTPFHKKYWLLSAKELKSVKKMVIMALLLGLTLISKLIVLPSGFGALGFRFGLIFLSVAAMIGGPLPALLIGALSDILGFFLFESGSGAFNPIFTASAMLSCFIYGLCFYRTNISFTKALIARIFVNFICNFLIEGFGQIIVYDYKFSWLYLTSLPKQVAYLIPQSIIIFVVLIVVAPIAADTNFIDEKIKKGISLF